MALLEEFRKICRDHTWRCTPQRFAVYEFMCDNLTHPSVDAVWESLRIKQPSLTRESVYRILNELSEAGLIRRLDQIENALYDSQMRPHGHFICSRCKKITDFELEKEPLNVLPAGVRVSSVQSVEFRVSGICENCARKTQKNKNNMPQVRSKSQK